MKVEVDQFGVIEPRKSNRIYVVAFFMRTAPQGNVNIS